MVRRSVDSFLPTPFRSGPNPTRLCRLWITHTEERHANHLTCPGSAVNRQAGVSGPNGETRSVDSPRPWWKQPAGRPPWLVKRAQWWSWLGWTVAGILGLTGALLSALGADRPLRPILILRVTLQAAAGAFWLFEAGRHPGRFEAQRAVDGVPVEQPARSATSDETDLAEMSK